MFCDFQGFAIYCHSGNPTYVLKSLHWLPVEKRIDFKVLLLVYCALHDEAPEYTRYAPGKNYCSNIVLVSSRTLVALGNHVFSIAVPETGMHCQDLSLSVNLFVFLVLKYISLNLLLIRCDLFSCIFVM